MLLTAAAQLLAAAGAESQAAGEDTEREKEYSYNWLESMPEIAQCIQFFNRVSLEAAKRGAP